MKRISVKCVVNIEPYGYCRRLKEAEAMIKNEAEMLSKGLVRRILKERDRRMKIARSLRGYSNRDLERRERKRWLRPAALRYKAKNGVWPKGYRP
jgi:hypothetical protein